MQSKALLKSIVVNDVNLPFCLAVNNSFESLNNADSVLRPRRKPNCEGDRIQEFSIC